MSLRNSYPLTFSGDHSLVEFPDPIHLQKTVHLLQHLINLAIIGTFWKTEKGMLSPWLRPTMF